MNAQTTRDLLTERPFTRFGLIESSSDNCDVRHRVIASLARTHDLVGVDIEDDGF